MAPIRAKKAVAIRVLVIASVCMRNTIALATRGPRPITPSSTLIKIPTVMPTQQPSGPPFVSPCASGGNTDSAGLEGDAGCSGVVTGSSIGNLKTCQTGDLRHHPGQAEYSHDRSSFRPALLRRYRCQDGSGTT